MNASVADIKNKNGSWLEVKFSTQQIIELCLDRENMANTLASCLENHARLFVVHGKRSYQSCGAKAMLDDVVLRSGSEMVEFDDFSENPKKDDVNSGLAMLKNNPPDLIIGLGGGSVLDMAKLIKYYSHQAIPLLAIPTTSGTGAESTHFAVCYINGVKHSISDNTILPNRVILYPPFTYQNGKYLTSCTGFDALAQAIEAYWNINSTTESDVCSLQAIDLIYPTLSKEMLSHEDRIKLLIGANYAGHAINITRTTVPHALSYTLTSKYGYPHGHAVALTFPFFFKYNLRGKAEFYRGIDYDQYVVKMNKLLSVLKMEDDPYVMMKSYIHRLGLSFDSERNFDDLVVAKGINLERAANTPISIDEDVIMDAVKSVREIIH